MELLGLDSSFTLIKTLRCTNIQWNRRYYEAGDFQLEMLASDWDTSIAYIYTHQRPETGMVQKIETEHTLKGDFVLVSGFFLEGMLNWKITHPKHSSIGNVSAACKSLVTSLMADTGVTTASEPDIGDSDSFNSENEPLGDATYSALKKQELSQRIVFDYDTETLLYSVWQGLDRTQSQSANTYAAFAQNFGNVDELTLTQDTSDMRNYAVVQYTLAEDDAFMELDLRAGSETKRILFIQSPVSQEEGQSDADYQAAVESDARMQMEEYEEVLNLDANVLQRNSFYLTDYDLGDKCDIRDDRLGLAFEARIIEINEVWKNNEHKVGVQFGTKIPTAYRKGY